MPSFSDHSNFKLDVCDDRLQALFREVVKRYDCTIICGHRNRSNQNNAYDTGKSRVRYPDSKHNTLPTKAVDVAPYISGRGIVWESRQCSHFAGYVQAVAERMEIPIRWGGDWDQDRDVKDQVFNDLVHFELDEKRK